MSTSTASDAALIAAFIAQKGVTRVAQGKSALGDMTQRDWARAVRTPGGVSAMRAEDENALIAQRRCVGRDHLGRELWVNGLGEPIAFG